MTDRETRVQEIAYQLWVQEGRPEGRHDAHWYEAEAVYDAEIAGDDLKSDSPDEMALSETAVAKAESGKKRAVVAAQKSGRQKSGGGAKSADPSTRDGQPANENTASEANKPSSARVR